MMILHLLCLIKCNYCNCNISTSHDQCLLSIASIVATDSCSQLKGRAINRSVTDRIQTYHTWQMNQTPSNIHIRWLLYMFFPMFFCVSVLSSRDFGVSSSTAAQRAPWVVSCIDENFISQRTSKLRGNHGWFMVSSPWVVTMGGSQPWVSWWLMDADGWWLIIGFMVC